MANDKETLLINARVEVPAAAIQAVVKYAKQRAGGGPVDTFAVLSGMISRFLGEKGFAAWVEDPANYEDGFAHPV
ncbi:MAG: hypothetical protein JRI97_07450 [Deltaproteobacteria bacterium]|nr:hypothetical protein [Deltaproteobacteria bacterium]